MSLRTAKRAIGSLSKCLCGLACLLALVNGLSALTPVPAMASEKVISGQVRDHKNRPLRSVRVDLWTKDGTISMSSKTNSEGKFSFAHEKCEDCFLEVMAPKGKNLASALVEDIPGDAARSIIVTLKRGYPVTGRVVHNGKGLKGIVVKAYSANHEKDVKARVYGGGAAITKRSGDFELVLTPGDKKLMLLNKRYKKIASGTGFDVKVIVDTNLGDIEMPDG